MQEQHYLFYILALISEILGTISGFGSSILFVPLASMFFDIKEVLGLTAIFHVFSNISKIYLFKNGFDKNLILKLGLPAIVAVCVGAVLSNLFSYRILEILLSVFLIIISAFLFFFQNKELKKSDANLYFSGAISGFLAGLIGTGGAVRGLALASLNIKKEYFIATSALIDLGVDSSRSVIYGLQGYVSTYIISFLPGLIMISYLGTWIGKWIVLRISDNVFKKWVLGIVCITAVIQLIKILFP